jgi:hypothetical protein
MAGKKELSTMDKHSLIEIYSLYVLAEKAHRTIQNSLESIVNEELKQNLKTVTDALENLGKLTAKTFLDTSGTNDQ